MIEIKQLVKTFGKIRALDDITLSLQEGRVVSLIGANGSGKTTLIKVILGLVVADSGSVTIGGKAAGRDHLYRSVIGYMPQIGRYPDNMTIGQVIGMIKEVRPDVSAYDEDLIEAFGIAGMQNKVMRTLSGGTRQKVSACLAFLFRPQILILDEPTAGLDPLASETLREKISCERSKGRLALITSHVLSDLEGLASHMIYLQDGKLLFYESIAGIRNLTGCNSLNQAVAHIMKDRRTYTEGTR